MADFIIGSILLAKHLRTYPNKSVSCDIGLEDPPTQRNETTKRIMMRLKKQFSSGQKEAHPPWPPAGLGHSLVFSPSLRLLVDERRDSVFVRKCGKLSSKEPKL